MVTEGRCSLTEMSLVPDFALQDTGDEILKFQLANGVGLRPLLHQREQVAHATITLRIREAVKWPLVLPNKRLTAAAGVERKCIGHDKRIRKSILHHLLPVQKKLRHRSEAIRDVVDARKSLQLNLQLFLNFCSTG